MDDLNLPAASGKTRLVLLVVDPYLIHAYWEIAPENREAKELAEQAGGVLRFYTDRRTSGEEMLSESFDIEINLQSRNWNVHLWKPEESIYADLALKRDDGTLIPLARSEVVHMPRAHPAIAIDQHFMKVEPVERRAEIVAAPPLEQVPVPAEPDRPQESMAPPAEELDFAPAMVKPIESAEIVREMLKKVYASVQWSRSGHEPETARAVEITEISTPPPGRPGTDLTATAEMRFTSGLSSGVPQKSRPEGGSDT